MQRPGSANSLLVYLLVTRVCPSPDGFVWFLMCPSAALFGNESCGLFCFLDACGCELMGSGKKLIRAPANGECLLFWVMLGIASAPWRRGAA